MSVYGYVRVSTDKQDRDNQRFGVLDFTHQRKLGHIEIVEETVSGRVSYQRRELGRLVERLQTGDTLVVPELSRLGRSMLEVMEILSVLTKQGVRVFAIKGNWELGDNVQSKVLAFAFALASEIERDMISARTKEALARRKAEGKPVGRPRGPGKSRLDDKAEELNRLLSYGVPKAAVARILGVSRNALNEYIKKRKPRSVRVGHGDTPAPAGQHSDI